MKNSAIRKQIRRASALERFSVMSFDQWSDLNFGQDYLNTLSDDEMNDLQRQHGAYLTRKNQELSSLQKNSR